MKRYWGLSVFLLCTLCFQYQSARAKWLLSATASATVETILRNIKSRLPLSSCRESILKELDIPNCEQVTDGDIQLIALRATNCHLESHGLPTYRCDTHDLATCTKNMKTNNDFTTYSMFKLDVERICDSLERANTLNTARETIKAISVTQDQQLQKLVYMESGMDELVTTRMNIQTGLEKSLEIGKGVLETQQKIRDTSSTALQKLKSESGMINSEIVKQQKKIVDRLEKLDSLSASINNRMGEFFPMLSNMHAMTQTFFHDLMAAKAIAFYVGFTLFAYFITVPYSVRAARAYMLISIGCCLGVELLLLRPLFSIIGLFDPTTNAQILSLFRSIAALLSFAALCHRLYMSYTNPELSKKDGYEILKNVYEMNRQSRLQNRLLLKGLMEQVIQWQIENPGKLKISNEHVLNALMEPPPNYSNNSSYHYDDDSNIPEVTRYIYDEETSGKYTAPATEKALLDGEAEDRDDLITSEDGENNDLLDQEIYDASLIPGESFAPEDYGEQCNGKQLLQATDDEAWLVLNGDDMN